MKNMEWDSTQDKYIEKDAINDIKIIKGRLQRLIGFLERQNSLDKGKINMIVRRLRPLVD
jgi:hypothetical protein